jgi:hypothetical protein
MCSVWQEKASHLMALAGWFARRFTRLHSIPVSPRGGEDAEVVRKQSGMMIGTEDHRRNRRREFLRQAAQGGLLAVLGGVVALAVRGRGVTWPGDCRASGPCGGCALLARCPLPAAARARRTDTLLGT